ncbi:hypothetical protein [Segetibacter koreensis]|uniref:hypothetical protein n=1 Tax=Segetibacter koreensis TaxID=398037 RepID=UPI000376D355|nr:hypothetical protein [Segetibacter koreensis]
MKKIIFCLYFFSLVYHSYGGNKADTGDHSPEVAKVGVLFVNISELDMSDNSFHADFYLWCRWKGTINPLKNIEFSNLEDEWSFSDTDLHDSAILLKDSFYYNSFHVRGKFTHNFKLHHYPFDKQEISIQLKNSIYTSDELVYSADSINTNFEPDITIPGWKIENLRCKSLQHKYSSNLGLPENKDNDSYNNVSFSLTLSRPVQYFFWKLLLPVFIVLLSSLGSTVIHPKYVDARIYAPIGALLTTVFLEQSYSSKLPDISYLILLDKIYLIVYIAILAGIFHAIYTANIVRDGSNISIKRAQRLDKIYLIILGGLLLVSPLIFLV